MSLARRRRLAAISCRASLADDLDLRVQHGEVAAVLTDHPPGDHVPSELDPSDLAPTQEHEHEAAGVVDDHALQRRYPRPRLDTHRAHPAANFCAVSPPHLAD